MGVSYTKRTVLRERALGGEGRISFYSMSLRRSSISRQSDAALQAWTAFLFCQVDA